MTDREAAPFPGNENIPFLQDEFIRHYSGMCSIEESSINEILRLRDVLLLKEPFVKLLWEFHDLLYEQELPFAEVIPENPKIGRILGDGLRGVFYYLLILSGMPLLMRRYQEKGWPDSLRDEIMSDVSVWVAHHKRNFGTPGLAWMVMSWFQGHINLELVGFGRLQFNTKLIFSCPVMAFRHYEKGTLKVLYAADKRFTAAGILDDLQEEPAEGSWISSFRETEEAWTGNPIRPDGFTEPETITLLKSEWELVLKPGDPVINIHIPESGPLVNKACHESMIRAREFFAQYLPDYRWKAFFCDSWLLDPQLPEILDANSNILAFQKHGYMIPFPHEADTIFRCFGVKGARDGIGTVPMRSTLQQRMARFLKDGRRFHYGAAFLLKDDLDTLNPYRE